MRLALAEYYLQDTQEKSFSKTFKIHDAILNIIKLKSDLFTFSETKDLAEAIDEIQIEVTNFERTVDMKINSNKNAELYKKLKDKIEKLLKTSL